MKTLLLLLCMVESLSLFAQPKQGQARLDSLLAEVPKMKEDQDGVRLMEKISTVYCNINPSEGLKWAEKNLALAQQIGWEEGKAMAYNNLGINYQVTGAYPAALDAFFKCLHIIEALGDTLHVGSVSTNVGNIYYRQNDYQKALEWYLKAARIAEALDDQPHLHIALSNIGNVYSDLNKYAESLDYYLKSLRISEKLNDLDGIGTGTGTGGIAGNYEDLKQYHTALAYRFRALRLQEAVSAKQGIIVSLGNIGRDYYYIASDSAAPRPDSLVPASRAANLAKAVEYLKRSIATSREAAFFEGIVSYGPHLSNALALQGDYRGALDVYQQFVSVKDSLHNIANNEAITNLETKRAVALKDKDLQIAKLKKRNERVLSIAGFAVLLLILGILFRSYKKQQHSNRLLAREKKRSDDLLLNILPAEVAEELKDNGASAARQFDEVSVLFTDFVDFTGTAEQLPPQVLVKELHECFTAFDAIIERNGLEKIKTIGDAYMAVCGLPVADPNHARKTVQAALDIRDFMADRAKQERVFAIRIGVNSGPVVAGIVGVKKFAYDIWGDTVNTAARMEQSGEAGQVNISQSTYELVRNEFACEYRGKITAKHKGDVAMYFVSAKAPVARHSVAGSTLLPA